MLASRPIPIYRLAGLAIVASQLLCVPSSAQPKAPTQPAGQPATKAQAAANYGRIPLSFEANRGQTDPSVQFLSHGQGYTLFLRQGEAVLALKSGKPSGPNPATSAGSLGIENAPSSDFESSVVRLQLAGANPHASVREEDRQITRTNYFIGKDPAKWRTDIPNYSRVRYADVYPGIDLVYYGNQSRLEHDFVVAPGADPARIRLALDGAQRVRIDGSTGDLVLKTGSGELRLLKPVTYQESNGKRAPISSRYRLLADDRIGFTVGRFDHAQPLVIDPVLVYSTLLGGPGPATGGGFSNYIWDVNSPGMDWISAVTIDSTGSAYLAGETFSASFPVTAGVLQSANRDTGNSMTGLVAKLDPTGSFLEYATYLGGSSGETCTSIAIDASGDAYVTGVTQSTDFPVTAGAFQSANNDPYATPFVSELNPTGTVLVYSTYLGGSGLNDSVGDYAYGIAVDSSGSAYVAGLASSKDFPVTKGAFQPEPKAVWNGFVTKLNPTGTQLIYSTYLSGSNTDFALAIAVDSSGHAYVTGNAESPDFPVTKGAFQTTMTLPPDSQGNAFVTKFNAAGSGLIYSTFLGGTTPDYDEGSAIAVDSSGNAYVTGQATSMNFPVTKGAFQTTNKDGSQLFTGFVTKFNSSGSGLIYSTYLGGSNIDFGTGIAIDSSGNAYVTGWASSTDFPVTPNAFQAVHFFNGEFGFDAFVTELNPTGIAPVYSTFLGANSGSTAGNGIAVDSSENVYVAGGASNGFPVSSGAFQTSPPAASSGDTGFVTKLDLASAAGGIQSSTKLVVSPQTALVPVTLTASVSAVGGGKTPAGNLDFRVDGQVVATVALNGSGGASYTSSALPGGAHTFAANYDGSSTYNPSSGDIYLTIPNPSLAAVSGMNQRAIYGVRFGAPLTVQLTDVSGENLAIPGIPVTFGGTGVNFASPTVMSDANGQAQAVGIAAQHGNVVATASIPNGANTAQFPLFCERAELDVRPQYPQFPGQVLRYGDTIPTPTAYDLVGLVNGDTAATAVTGAPVMTIPATSTSPAGVYPIEIAKGTLAAANYNIGLQRGVLQIYRAPVTVTANNVTMTQGSAVPPLTYTLAGFLNGDTAAVVTGAPLLWTTATSSSPPGTYPIWVYRDTLSAPNYEFTAVDGTLTIQ